MEKNKKAEKTTKCGKKMEKPASVKKEQSCYIYIVRCRDNTLYTGWTTDLDKRMAAHNSGKGAKYTKSRIPVELIYYEKFTDKREAMRREYAIKQLTRKEKECLIHLN